MSLNKLRTRDETKVFFSHIIGAKGLTRKRLETETGCRITVPKPGQSGDIVVTGSSRKNVASARRRINLIIISVRKRQDLTHFVSFHLMGDDYVEGFIKFQSLVLENCPDRGVVKELFQLPNRFHITIVAVTLSDDVERAEVADCLKECHDVIIKPRLAQEKLKIMIQGLDYMNDDPSQVRVLYAKAHCINNSTMLQEFANMIKTELVKRGYVGERDKSRSEVKLHITLMNSKFLKEFDESSKLAHSSFDATNILKNYKDFVFGEAVVSSLELCVLRSSQEGSYYTITASVSLLE